VTTEGGDAAPAVQIAPAPVKSLQPPPAVVRWLGFIVIFGVICLSIWMLFNPTFIARFGSWGYLGAFLVNLFASASLFLPVPGLPIAIAMGVSMNGFLLALASGGGSAVGELAGYFIGRGSRALSTDTKISQWAPRIEAWTNKYGAFAIFVIAALPLPFDFAGIAAGAGRMAVWKFLVATFLGKFLKYYVVILVASGSLAGVRDLMGW
jgi:membrane protein YqaA with SNARE-associated domain